MEGGGNVWPSLRRTAGSEEDRYGQTDRQQDR